MPATTLADRAIIRVSGEGARDFLQGLVTSDLARLAPDRPLWAGLLTPQGKALFDFILWAEGDDVLIDAEAATADALARRLALYRLRRPITIEPDPALAVHWSPHGQLAAGAMPDPRLATLGLRWLAPPSDAASGWHAHRLGLGVTEGLAELGSGDTLWLECNAAELNGVSYAKGCYVGQENTARMHYRAKVNRRLVVEPLADDDNGRVRLCYPELGLQIAHRRVDDILPSAAPAWLRDALLGEADSA